MAIVFSYKGEVVQISVSTGRPGTKKFSCPFVPGQGQEQKSRDKLLCPGMSRDKITFTKKPKRQEKNVLKQKKNVLKQERTFKNRKRTF